MAVLAEGQRQVVQLSKQVVTVARSGSVGEESSSGLWAAAQRGASPRPMSFPMRAARQIQASRTSFQRLDGSTRTSAAGMLPFHLRVLREAGRVPLNTGAR